MNTNTLSADAMRQIIFDLDSVGEILARMENHPELRKLGAKYLNNARDRLLRASLSDVAVETERRAA